MPTTRDTNADTAADTTAGEASAAASATQPSDPTVLAIEPSAVAETHPGVATTHPGAPASSPRLRRFLSNPTVKMGWDKVEQKIACMLKELIAEVKGLATPPGTTNTQVTQC